MFLNDYFICVCFYSGFGVLVVTSLSVLVDIQTFVLDTGGNTQAVDLLDSEE